MSSFPEHTAWDFITRLYAQPGVASACLALQDRHGVDVTLMLFCLWRGSINDAISNAHMAALTVAAREWREATVLPIRAARRWLKQRPNQDSLYRSVLSAEIDSEHGELLMLAQLADTAGCHPQKQPLTDVMTANLAALFREFSIRPDERDCSALTAIIGGAEAIADIGRAPLQQPLT